MNCLVKIMPQHHNRIQVRTLTRPLQSLHLVFLQPFSGGLAGVLWITVLLQNPRSLQLKVMNRWPDILLQDFLVDSRIHGSIYCIIKSSRKQQNSPRPSHYCCYVLFLKCGCLDSPQSIFPKVLGIIKMFSGKNETSLNVLFALQWFSSWNSAMPFLPSLFLMVES